MTSTDDLASEGEAAPAYPPSPDTSTTQDERLFAGLAYVAHFAGLWVIGPLGLYLWKGKQSRFLAFHSMQALLLSLALFVAGFAALFLYIASSIVVALSATRPSKPLMFLPTIIGGVLVLLLVVLPQIAAVVAAVRSFHGKTWSMPIIGRLAVRLLRGHESGKAAAAAGSGTARPGAGGTDPAG